MAFSQGVSEDRVHDGVDVQCYLYDYSRLREEGRLRGMVLKQYEVNQAKGQNQLEEQQILRCLPKSGILITG